MKVELQPSVPRDPWGYRALLRGHLAGVLGGDAYRRRGGHASVGRRFGASGPFRSSVLSSQGRVEPFLERRRHRRERGHHLDAAAGESHQTGTGQLIHVHGPGEGAAALGGGGEPEEVGDRSRSQERGPPSPRPRIIQRPPIAGGGEEGADRRPALGGASQGEREAIGSVRRWRGSHLDGRTYISMKVSGRCRDLVVCHALWISSWITTINSDTRERERKAPRVRSHLMSRHRRQ